MGNAYCMAFDVRWMDRKFYGVELMNAKTLHVYRVIFRMDEMIFIIIYSFYFIFLFFSNTHDNRMKINWTNGNTQIHRILCWGLLFWFQKVFVFFFFCLVWVSMCQCVVQVDVLLCCGFDSSTQLWKIVYQFNKPELKLKINYFFLAFSPFSLSYLVVFPPPEFIVVVLLLFVSF